MFLKLYEAVFVLRFSAKKDKNEIYSKKNLIISLKMNSSHLIVITDRMNKWKKKSNKALFKVSLVEGIRVKSFYNTAELEDTG